MLILRQRVLIMAAIVVTGLAVTGAARPAVADRKNANPSIIVKPIDPKRNSVGFIAESPGDPGTQGTPHVPASSGNRTGRPGPAGTCGPECQQARGAVLCVEKYIPVFSSTCDSAPAQRAAPVQATPGQLAQRAYGQLSLASPTMGRSPAETLPDGRPYTVVNMYTWYWTSPATYRPVSKRVQAGAVWVLVTARPVALRFDPGNGDQPVSCAGPGRAWRVGADGQWDRAPGGCDYRYRKSSLGYPNGQLAAEAGILWRVSWVGSTGTAAVSGSLPDLLTTTAARFAVAEGQSVVRR